jgi:hypothetical protein
MLSKNSWKTFSLVAVLLVAAGCTNDGLDDGSSADVILEIVSLDNTPVTANLTTSAQGTCFDAANPPGSGTLCSSTAECPQTEACVRPTLCLFEVQQWSASVASAPKNSLALPPFNDVRMQTVDIRYDWNPTDGLQFGQGVCSLTIQACQSNTDCPVGEYCALAGSRNFGLGDVTIPAQGTNTVSFFPIAGQDLVLALEGQTLSLELVFRGRTVEGTDVNGTTRSELYVETCN